MVDMLFDQNKFDRFTAFLAAIDFDWPNNNKKMTQAFRVFFPFLFPLAHPILRPRLLSAYPESEYSRQRADVALKLGGREERGKERIL